MTSQLLVTMDDHWNSLPAFGIEPTKNVGATRASKRVERSHCVKQDHEIMLIHGSPPLVQYVKQMCPIQDNMAYFKDCSTMIR